MVHDWNRESFERLLVGRDRAHHALLLAGPAGIGKSALALELARTRLCESPGGDGAACGRCNACGWFDAGNHPDFRLLQPASADERDAEGDGQAEAASARGASRGARKPSREIRIEQIRALDGFLDVGAHRGGQRVVVVDPADAMNTIAANGLLKRLEEPPPGASFILVASQPSRLPATIRSRCQRIPLALPAPELALAWLLREAAAGQGGVGQGSAGQGSAGQGNAGRRGREVNAASSRKAVWNGDGGQAGEPGVSQEEALQWLAAAGGAPLHALRLARTNDAAEHRRVLDAFASMPEAGIVATADALAGVEPVSWCAAAQTWAADLARVGAGGLPRRHPDRSERLHRLAARTTLARLMALEQRLRALPRQAAHPLNPRLLLEDVLLEYHRALS